MKKSLLLLGLTLLAFKVTSQELPKLLPPSPEVFEMVKYGDLPINGSSGISNITIPITNYFIGDINIPIELNYTTSGIKVNQLSSWVGMGWNLKAGGLIARIVDDIPDENASTRVFPTSNELESLKNSPNKVDYYEFIYDVARNDPDDHDTGLDIYKFDFNNLSGEFIIDSNGNYKLVKNENNLKIESITSGFKITDIKGTQYFFDITEKIKIINSCNRIVWEFTEPNKEYITTWFLTKIKALNGDEIYFQYKNSSFHFSDSLFQSISKNTNIIEGTAPTCNVTDNYNYSNCINRFFYSTKVLEKITNNRDNTKIIFTSNKDRIDLEYGNSVFRLSSIEIFDNSKLIKKTILNNAYIESNKSWVNEIENVRNVSHKYRLFLNSVYDEYLGEINNKYSFLYDNPQDLPPRLSYSQDGIGFYNGIISSSMIPGFASSADTPQIFRGLNLGDRRSNFNFVTKGILKKIIYPSKGETEFEYEPGFKLFTRKGFYNYTNFELEAEEDGTNLSTCLKSQNFTPNFTEVINVNINNFLIGNGYDILHDRSLVEIKNLTTNQIVLDLNLALGQNDYLVNFLKGNTYKIKITMCNIVKFDHMKSIVSFNYIQSEFTGDNFNASGVRIFKRINRSGNGLEEINEYYYSSKENFNSKFYHDFSFSNNFEIENYKESSCNYVPKLIDPPYINLNTFHESIISSTNNSPIIYLSNNQVLYQNVTVSNGQNFEQGGTEFKYDYVDSGNQLIYGEKINNSSVSNLGLNNGRLLEETTFSYKNGFFTKLKEKKLIYNTTNQITESFKLYQGNTRFTNNSAVDPSSEINSTDALKGMDVSSYVFYTTCNELNKTMEKTFFDEKVIEIETNIFYDSLKCNREMRRETIDSKNSLKITRNNYSNLPSLLSNNRFFELESKEELIDTNTQNILSKTFINYQDWGNNIILPQKIQTSKGTQALEDRIIYHSYDSKGNPQEVSKKDGTKIYYVWGYNQTQPIAKIEGYTDAQLANVQSLITSAELASDNDNDTCKDSTTSACNEKSLRTQLNNLRNSPHLVNTQVTSFTYDPLVGVTSITDPRGQTIYYDYDDFNRLKQVVDKDDNILSKNEYHYKN